MKEIKLLSLELVNFKGVSSLHLDFTDNTCVCGANGTGKTTVCCISFDSYIKPQVRLQFSMRSAGSFSERIAIIELIQHSTSRHLIRMVM